MNAERLIRDMAGVALLAAALLMAVALVTHNPLDPSPFHLSSSLERPTNLAGWLGSTVSAALLGLVGLTAALIPILAAVLGWRLLRRQDPERPRAVSAGWTLILLGLPGFVHILRPEMVFREGVIGCGGVVGHAAADLLGVFAGPVGRVVVLALVVILGLLLVTGGSAATVADGLQERLNRRLETGRQRRAERRREKERSRDRQRVLERQLARLESSDEYRGSVTVKEVEGKGRFRVVRRQVEVAEPEATTEEEPAAPAPPRQRQRQRSKAKPRRPEPAAPVVQEEFEFVEDLESYDVPRPSFLEAAEEVIERDSSALIGISELITQKCQEFRVGGEVVNIRTGPVITTYEYRLDSGVKISAVQNLSEDLALALRTEAVRIERIPGRATVGIEVPSPDPEVIRLRTLVEATEFQRAQSLLTLSMGVDIRGKPTFADLQRMPHLLIGGFTGSGKSVGINAMIMSILFKARPDQVRFIFVDPKMVELGVYSDIPHLLTPIITDPKKAANALGWAVDEMEQRYHKLAALGVRNLEQYNQLVENPSHLRRTLEQRFGPEDVEAAAQEYPPLPFIVIIIDELADLMMTSGRAVEESITRLAQKARAVGVHLICATQRPSVDILTGTIKANFPCRVAYKVRSKFDSRTILDVMGAEHLLGRGDMLFLPPGSSTLVRLHGPLVTEKEIATTVRYVKRFGKPDYLREIITHKPLGEDKSGRGRRTEVDSEEELSDPMYDQAARLVVTTRKASASYIQRRLHLGYTRSARLLDMMEREGLVGPLAGSKGREVLVPENYFGEVDETLALNGEG